MGAAANRMVQSAPVDSIALSLLSLARCNDWPQLALDVLVHAAGAESGMLLDSAGVVVGCVGLACDISEELAAACRVSGPGASGQLFMPSLCLSYETLALPTGTGLDHVLVLTREGHDPLFPDTTATSALLPPVGAVLDVHLRLIRSAA